MSTVGRPTIQESAETDKLLRVLYEADVGIMASSQKTGHSPKTVSKRYKQWDKELAGTNSKKFLARQHRAKDQALLALDKQLIELITIQQQIIERVIADQALAKNQKRAMTNDEIKSEMRIKISWHISDLTDKKTALEMTPTVADRVKTEVEKYIARAQKRPLTKETREGNQ